MAEWRDLLTPENLAALECFIAAQEGQESLPAAVNGILTDWLSGYGYLPVEELPEGDD
ncbi:hypothetical protein [Methylobacterium thuringiense]|uniref:CopG family transcriptional regulator n=1 Tax=Methylobacterium thuringiense TaxID=1003091 RepID=A0ABQ4TRP5_9HYPH|nr:hypothetical protein [Methylobacterium thuringiense]GJE57377.1 hypothetical protein EKPJFOCH_3891 [Methylobacterium thuringiense]